jgi:nicotinamidase-related amidase
MNAKRQRGEEELHFTLPLCLFAFNLPPTTIRAMRHPNLIDAKKAALVVVDLQEAFRPAIFEFDQIVARTAILVQGAKLLGLPILATEQYPQRLGATVADIANHLPDGAMVPGKMCFSCCGAGGFVERLRETKASQVIVSGIEAHVCVNQTAHDLLAEGFQVHLVLDAISSRTARDRAAGIEKMLRSGAIPCSVEMALFEMMVDAKHERFKEVQKLVK